jgi:hypothetical protein
MSGLRERNGSVPGWIGNGKSVLDLTMSAKSVLELIGIARIVSGWSVNETE